MILYQTENFGKRYEYRTASHEDWIMPPHIHEFSEFAYTKRGTTTVYVDGQKHLVNEGHLILILPNQIHEYTDETHSVMRCAVFSNDHIPAFFEAVKNKKPENPIIDLRCLPELANMVEHSSEFDTIKISALLYLLCGKVLDNSRLVERENAEHSMFFEAIRYISQNFKENIELKSMAKMLGYHEKHLSTVLHSRTGMNFREFLAHYRIDYAKELLRSRDKSDRISEIAFKCGFSSINSFNRAFLKATVMTPRDYKNDIFANKR